MNFNFTNCKNKILSSFHNLRHKSSFEQIISNLNPEKQKLIYLHHEWGGGADLYLQNKIQQLKNDNYIFVILYKKKLGKINLQITFQNQFSSILLNNFGEIADLFSKIKIDAIYLNQVSFFPNLAVVFDFIKQTKADKKIMLAHDFSSICAKTHLLKDDGNKCEIISNNSNCACNSKAGENVKKWREIFINQIDEVICFSEHSKQIIGQFYREISSKIKVEPHYVPFLRKVNVVKSDPIINIAVVGFLNKIKGADIVEQMAQIIIDNQLPARIIVVGKCKKKENLALKILGKYHRQDLPEIIEKHQIDIIFISSICSETFSYTTHEAMLMEVKVACFDLGAQAEYVKEYSAGLIIQEINAKTALNQIINFAKPI
ncbi:MAG: glycosyltransferase [Pseudomonadota bacterium]